MAIDHFDMFPKHVIAEEFQNKDQPDLFRPDEPDSVFADCKLPIYELVDGECGELDEGGDEEVEDEVFN
jgi:hypothetical protein